MTNLTKYHGTHAHTHTHTHTHVHMHTNTHGYTWIHMDTHTHACKYTQVMSNYNDYLLRSLWIWSPYGQHHYHLVKILHFLM